MNNKKKNLKIAEDYCKSVKERTERVWISNNLINLPSGDRKAILKVYRKNFHTVEYDNETGVCKCWVIDPKKAATNINELDIGLLNIMRPGDAVYRDHNSTDYYGHDIHIDKNHIVRKQ